MAKLLFVQNLDFEFLGPMYISSFAAARGHICRAAVVDGIESLAAEIESFKPDALGFSIMTGSHEWARRLALEAKKKYGVASLFGGAHPTFYPEFLKEDGVDFIVRGEGEDAVSEILGRISDGRPFRDVANLGYKKAGEVVLNPVRALEKHLDDYPFPDRHLYDILEGRTDRAVRTVLTGRGCPYSCSFCFEASMRELYRGKGKYVRSRRAENVVEECIKLKKDNRARIIYFADDIFGADKKWLYDFLELYKTRVGLEFVCLVRADVVSSDDDYARRLAAAGCRNVFFGIETGNEDLRNRVLDKRVTDGQIKKAARMLHEAGIKFRSYNIVGLPDETLDDAFKTLRLNIEIKTDYPWCSIFAPYPGTRLADYAKKKGYLPEDFDYSRLAGSFFVGSPMTTPGIREIQNLQKFFQTAVLCPASIPVIKLLIKLPPNIFFRLWFGLVYFYYYVKSERRQIVKTFVFALRNFRRAIS